MILLRPGPLQGFLPPTHDITPSIRVRRHAAECGRYHKRAYLSARLLHVARDPGAKTAEFRRRRLSHTRRALEAIKGPDNGAPTTWMPFSLPGVYYTVLQSAAVYHTAAAAVTGAKDHPPPY